MPSQQNVKELSVIKEKKAKAKSVMFAHYRGLKVNEVTALRAKVREAGGEMLVTKNTLLRIAFENDTLSEALTGPTVAIFSYQDEVAPLKATTEFAKTQENNLPVLTAGYLEGKAINADGVKQLANLPGKEQLLAQVVGTMAAPLTGFLSVLQGNTRKLVYALKAIHDQKAS